MKPLVSQLADALVVELNNATFTPAVVAQRIYRPVHSLPQLDEIKLLVVPRSFATSATDRGADQLELQVDVGVRRRVRPDEDEDIDQMLSLLDQVSEWLNRRQLVQMPAARFLGLLAEPIYDPEDLDNRHVFTGVLTATYRLLREVA